MKTNILFQRALAVMLFLGALSYGTYAQTPVTESNNVNREARSSGEIQFTKLRVPARPVRRTGFALMPSSYANTIAPAFRIASMAALPNLAVTGSGTLGRLTKWTGFTSSNAAIGDTTIYEDKFGMVGIGTDSPTSKLTVAGLIGQPAASSSRTAV
jgi:hypothetical protein